jgi:hypothetical protein
MGVVPFSAGRWTGRYGETNRNRSCFADASKMGRQIFKSVSQFLLLLVVDVKVKHFLTLPCNIIMNFRDTLRKGAGYSKLPVT